MVMIEFLLKGGYSGGHTSQASWDMETEYRAERKVLKLFPFVKTLALSNMGDVGGYYPSIVVKAEQEIIDKIERELPVLETHKVVNDESYYGVRHLEWRFL